VLDGLPRDAGGAGEGGDVVQEPTAEKAEAEDTESLRKLLAEEKEKAEKYLANWQRAQADFINYRRHTEQERAEATKLANATLILNLLPILDDLERALNSVPAKLAGLPWLDGVRLIQRKLQAVLGTQGLSPIEVVGKDFDPNLHEAVLYGEGEEGKVIQEIQKGYRLHDRVLRPAQVGVGRRAAERGGEAKETGE